MKAQTRTCFTTLLFLLLAPASALSGLWPFSPSESTRVSMDVDIDYLHVNGIALSENEKAIRIYYPFLQDGMIYVRGKARVGHEGVGAVYFSTDGQKNWQSAAFLSNDTISFGFRPEQGSSYDLFVKVVNKNRGHINDVERTHLVINVPDHDIHSAIETALAGMIAAYENEDPVRFIRSFSNFDGDTLMLGAAVRQDFTFLDSIDLREIITGISPGEGGRVHVAIAFTRLVISARNGQVLQDNGTTELVFETTGEYPKVCRMNTPLLFGVSNPAGVASGIVDGPANTRTLVVAGDGTAEIRPFADAMEVFTGTNENVSSTTAAIAPSFN